MKKIVFCLILLLSLGYVTGCVPPAEQTDQLVQHADPFYNMNYNDYPLLHLPLIKPVEAKREDGRTSWRIFLQYGIWVFIPNSQEAYAYDVEELEKFAVKNRIIMAYSPYVNKEANAYIRDNYYHWFVIVPDKKTAKGFQTEDEFRQYIQSLGVQDPDWQTPDKAYEKFAQAGCLEWIPDCE